MKTGQGRERGRSLRHSIQSANLKKRYMNGNPCLTHTHTHPLPPCVVMSEKTASRNPSSRGNCKGEKQEAARERIFSKCLSLDFFE